MKNDASVMNKLFEKLDDLKTIFLYSEKLIPVIQKLIDFMSNTIPLLENINQSITETASKIPSAANQIDSVTNATEMATTEILDTVDKILLEISSAKEKLSRIIQMYNDSSNEEIKGNLNSINVSLDNINQYANNVTISLQVQDITAQQLAAVNYLIQSVQERLSTLFKDLEDSELSGISKYTDKNVFNENARYQDTTQQQKMIDQLINGSSVNNPTLNSSTSQDEIDKLFLGK
jgi:chemotaxis regulatin CheY-phosphate phosphatase CheZ